MPTFPAKINYAAGNVLTAAQMVDIGNGLNDLLPDAKGSLTTVSAANTPAQLTVGNNGETLVADSSTSTGLRYNPQNALANPVVNGGMDVWQRGTSYSQPASSGSIYTADRWAITTTANAACTISRQTTSDTTNLPNIQYALRIQRNSGQTGVGGQYMYQNFESVNSIPFAGKPITVSFYAKAGATFLSSGASIAAKLWSGTGTDQNVLTTGLTGQTSVASLTPTLTTSWQRFVMTGTVGTNVTQLAIGFDMGAVGTAGATDFVETTGWQIDLGTYTASSAPTFRRSGGTLAGERSACERYYFRTTPNSAYSRFGMGQCTSSTAATGYISFPNTMRIAPTALEQSGTASQYAVTTFNQGVAACSAVPTYDGATVNGASVNFTVGSGLTAGDACQLLPNANTTAYLGWSAEL